MTLTGRTVALRPLAPSDYGPLYELSMSGQVTTWRNLARSVPPEAFSGFLWEGVVCQQVVCLRDDPSSCIGLVALFNEDPANQVAYLSVLIDETAWSSTAGPEAVALWLRHVFSHTGLRKVYAETTDLSLEHVALGRRLPGAREEGRLKGHLIRAGQSHDLVVVAWYASTFLQDVADILAFVDRSNDAVPVVPSGHRAPAFAEFVNALGAAFPELTGDHDPADLAGGVCLADDLGFDSVALLEVVCWLESHYRVVFDDDRLSMLATLEDLYRVFETAG